MSNGQIKIENGKYSGEIRTMRIFLKFSLEKVEKMLTAKSPTHNIIARAPAGHMFQAGVAWERVIQRGDSAGQLMISMMLDDPEFGDKPINLSAFPSGDGWLIQLDRSRQVSPQGDGDAVSQAAA